MRRVQILAVLLLAVLLLTACGARFEIDENGQGYTDSKTDTFYRAMPATFEAASRASEALGEFEDKEFAYILAFYEIPELDPLKFLADENGFVYCAADPMPTFADFAVDTVLVCDEDAISVEVFRVSDAAKIQALCEAWREGEATELPLVRAKQRRRLKMASPDYPNLYYCVNFYLYEDGAAYLYDSESSRAVLCSPSLAQAFQSK